MFIFKRKNNKQLKGIEELYRPKDNRNYYIFTHFYVIFSVWKSNSSDYPKKNQMSRLPIKLYNRDSTVTWRADSLERKLCSYVARFQKLILVTFGCHEASTFRVRWFRLGRRFQKVNLLSRRHRNYLILLRIFRRSAEIKFARAGLVKNLQRIIRFPMSRTQKRSHFFAGDFVT